MTTYPDEISMGGSNGSNGVPTLSAVLPLAIEEPEASLIPQIALQQPSEDLFNDQRIFYMHHTTIGIFRVLRV